MAQCGGITQGITYDCANPIVPGVVPDVTLLNLKDIDTITYDVTNTHVITDITLKSGTQGYKFEGFRQSLRPQYAYVRQPYSTAYDHQVELQVFGISADDKKNLEQMALGKIVAVVENLDKSDNVTFEVYGLDVGLEVMTLTRIAADLETGGSFSLNLMTPDDAGKEPKLPATWFDTDYATTKAKVEALLTPVP